MCNHLSRRAFARLMAGALMAPHLAPHLAFAQNTDAIRALHGTLNFEPFKAKKAARLSSEADQTIFTVGEDAFLADANFNAEIALDEAGVMTQFTILSGQVLAVLKPRTARQTDLLMPNSTASIRGTGFYANVDLLDSDDYICCCYGHILFQNASNGDVQQLKNSYHNATAIDEKGDFYQPQLDYPYGHYDDELLLLERLVGRQPHWALPDDKMHFLSPKPLPVV